MYLCNYNDVLVRKYVTLSIPLVKIVGSLGPCVRFPYSWQFLLGEKCWQYFMQKFVILSSIWKRDKHKILYFLQYENETSIKFYTFLSMRTRKRVWLILEYYLKYLFHLSARCCGAAVCISLSMQMVHGSHPGQATSSSLPFFNNIGYRPKTSINFIVHLFICSPLSVFSQFGNKLPSR